MNLRRVAAAVVLVLAASLAAGCAGSDGMAGPGTERSPQPSSPDPSPGPLALVGLWRVTEAEGVEGDTWLRLDAGEYTVWAPCGGLMSGWLASKHAFVAASPSSGLGGCEFVDLPWLTGAVAYEADGEGWRLLDSSGAITARLKVDGEPPLREDTIESMLRAPVVTDRTREWLADPAPLLDSLTPVSSDDLTGRWRSVIDHETEPFLDLADDRTWTGSDGCNQNGGAWAVDDGSRILATSGSQTEIGCDGEALPSALATARRAGLEADARTLVLLDGAGQELARLVRD